MFLINYLAIGSDVKAFPFMLNTGLTQEYPFDDLGHNLMTSCSNWFAVAVLVFLNISVLCSGIMT